MESEWRWRDGDILKETGCVSGLLTEVVGCIVRITPSGELYNLLAFPEPRPASYLHLICIVNLHIRDSGSALDEIEA